MEKIYIAKGEFPSLFGRDWINSFFGSNWLERLMNINKGNFQANTFNKCAEIVG